MSEEAATGRITFESVTSTFTILNPFNNFAAEEHCVEVRKDPLLGDTSVYNPFLRDKAKFFFGENDRDLIRCLFKIIMRQNLYPAYRNDDYFLQKLLQAELIFNLPEKLAEQLRAMF